MVDVTLAKSPAPRRSTEELWNCCTPLPPLANAPVIAAATILIGCWSLFNTPLLALLLRRWLIRHSCWLLRHWLLSLPVTPLSSTRHLIPRIVGYYEFNTSSLNTAGD